MGRVEELAREMLAFALGENPLLGTHLGLHEHDHRLPELSLAQVKRESEHAHEFLSRLREINPAKEERVDWMVLEQSLELQILHSDEIRLWRTSPVGASTLGGSLFPLLTRDFAPLERRMESVVARLRGCAAMLERSKERVEAPVRIRVESALMGAGGMPRLLKSVEEEGAKTSLKEEAADAAAKAVEEVARYTEWMKSLLPNCEERFWIGEELLTKLLFRRGIQVSPEAMVLFGKLQLAELKKRARELTGTPFDQDYLPATKHLKETLPKSFDDALDLYRRSVSEAREFVMRERVAPLPEGEKCDVVSTPEYMKPLVPFAAYFSPARYDPVQQGIYIVTDAGPASLERHDLASIVNTSVHEAYPGHHLQLCWAHRNASTARIFAHATEMVEGWAHYCEEMMAARGFHASKELELTRVLDLIWRADRVIIDVLLHNGKLSYDQAVDLLVRDTGMERKAAESEVRRYASSPGQPLSYLYGKEEIKKMRKEWEERLGAGFDEFRFHEAILKAGSLPLSIMRVALEEELQSGLARS
jgi:uncharacterized protein (DUF885 family)